jgi:hypothetical protein
VRGSTNTSFSVQGSTSAPSSSAGSTSSSAAVSTSSSSAGSSGSASSSGATPGSCRTLLNCCEGGYFFYPPVAASASCSQVAFSGDTPLCELALLSVQNSTGPLDLDDASVCGLNAAEGSPIPPESNPACEALAACGSVINDASDSATCNFVATWHFSGPCANTLSYFQSLGACGSVMFDAGTWDGLPPVIGDAGHASTSTGFSHSSH